MGIQFSKAVKHLADGTIPEEEFDDYEFNGNFQEMFNGYFTELYDLADERITLSNNVIEKFLWIE